VVEVKIVKLDASRLHLLDAVGPDVFDDAIDPAQSAAFVADPSHLMVLAIAGDEVVGFASGVVNLHPDKAPVLFLSEIGTIEALRRKGIATRLARALTDEARAQGCKGVWLATDADNDAARGLYRALGATETQGVIVYDWDLGP